VDNALGRDRKVLLLERLVILYLDEIVGAELVAGYWLSLAVDELDRGVVAMLGKEGDGLLPGLDLGEKLPDVGAFADVISSSGLTSLVLAFILCLLDDVAECLEGWASIVILILLAFHALVHLHVFHFLSAILVVFGFHAHLIYHVAVFFLDPIRMWTSLARQWRKLSGVDDTRRGLARLASLLGGPGPSSFSSCRLLVGEHGQRVFGELDVGIEIVEALVVGAVLPLRG